MSPPIAQESHRQVACFALLAGLIVGAAAAPTLAEDPSAAVTADARASASASDPRVGQVRALVTRSLTPEVSPQSLFDVPLSDEAAIEIEVVRIRALLRAVDQATQPPPPPAPVKPGRGRPVARVDPDAGTLRADLEAVDSVRWHARVELDHARLDFYSLSRQARDQLLQAHADRQEAAKPKETADARRMREAEAERRQALDAARAARTEAERAVSEQLARLISVEATLATLRSDFQEARKKLTDQQNIVLGLQRRARSAKAPTSTDADATYLALRRALRASRDNLARALDEFEESSAVPKLGVDTLASIPPEIPTDHVRERRAALEHAISAALADERAFRQDRAAALLDAISTLNGERLGLLSYLSPDQRDAVTGFTLAGWDQAQSEARHLALVLRYHQHAARTWIGSWRAGGSSAPSAWKVVLVAIPWFILVGAFSWARRRTPALLRLADHRMGVADRAERRISASPQRRLVRFIAKIHGTVEWFCFFVATRWLLPTSANQLLEVQLLSSAVGWVLGGALVVDIINAFAAETGNVSTQFDDPTGTLRFRSLRLVGRTVVVFALFLVLSSRLVGEGTIYSWVFSTCWFAAIPVFLLLVRWWRATIFERMERTRKKSSVDAWVLLNRSGWKSFLAAMVGAVHLFSVGVVKSLRSRLSGFDLARRAHAYLFRRGLDRLGETGQTRKFLPLGAAARSALDPEAVFSNWLSCPCDEIVDHIAERCARGRGGIIAVVGARGMGKSSLLRVLAARFANSSLAACEAHASTTAALQAIRALDESPNISPTTAQRLILVDDAQALVKLVLGGLALFDDLISFARARCSETTWVLVFDACVWPFLERARDARPMFDEIFRLDAWDEAQIGALLDDRCARAGIAPSYEDLLDRLPPGADDVDRLDALKANELGYVRMLWDHVRGNPGLALEAWRASLAVDEAGAVHVRPLQLPDSSGLDALPDSSVFILRAVLQLAPATIEDIAHATRLSSEQVVNAIRLGRAQGYFAEQDGRAWVTWPWLRPVMRLLDRRHLLVNP